MKSDMPILPVAVIGAGPIGLAAAAHLVERGFQPLVFEAGSSVAAHLESYRHVQLFSPWRYNVDHAARRLLASHGAHVPEGDELPTAGALVDDYLGRLAAVPKIASAIRVHHKVVTVSRDGFDKVKSKGREDAPFILRVETPKGVVEFRAWAVIDASGTWGTQNPMGANGVPAIGEREARQRIAYGMPDILGAERQRYAGKRVLVVGAGHSAAGNLLALAKLAEEVPATRLAWTIRGHNFARIFGGGENDGLVARGALGQRLKRLAESGRLELHPDFLTERVIPSGTGLAIEGRDPTGKSRRIDSVDEIIVAAGGRPDLSLAAELRVKLDPWVESTEQLAPLIDPNVHSCGTVRPHGHRELAHPEMRFYAVGAKSYGRAPNFLLATGHEQVRSVVAALAGDLAAADEVQLELPQTGVCSTQFDEASSACCSTAPAEPITVAATAPAKKAEASCCGGPPVTRTDACCVKDEVAKGQGQKGCGCGTARTAKQAA